MKPTTSAKDALMGELASALESGNGPDIVRLTDAIRVLGGGTATNGGPILVRDAARSQAEQAILDRFYERETKQRAEPAPALFFEGFFPMHVAWELNETFRLRVCGRGQRIAETGRGAKECDVGKHRIVYCGVLVGAPETEALHERIIAQTRLMFADRLALARRDHDQNSINDVERRLASVHGLGPGREGWRHHMSMHVTIPLMRRTVGLDKYVEDLVASGALVLEAEPSEAAIAQARADGRVEAA